MTRSEAKQLAVDELVRAVDSRLEAACDEACSQAGIGLEGDSWMDFRDEVLIEVGRRLENFDF